MRAIVLSGGGARGAYEVGLLLALLERAKAGTPFAELVCGTSVGAITGAYLAAGIDDVGAASQLEALWSGLAIEDVLAFGPSQVAGLPRLLLGGNRPAGMFDPSRLGALIESQVRWDQIASHVAAGRLRAFTVTATDVRTGAPTIFVQRGEGMPRPDPVGRPVSIVDAHITHRHVLASAALPLLFPPVSLDGELYYDGGLKLNTPLGPAVRLGATALFAADLVPESGAAELTGKRYPGAAFLMGKVLSALLLDRVAGDVDELNRINQFLADGEALCGSDFLDRFGELAESRGQPPFHPVRAFVFRPSEDPALLAADHISDLRRRLGKISAARMLLRAIDLASDQGADLASFLLFDHGYARDLIDLGRRDGLARSEDLDAFLATDPG